MSWLHPGTTARRAAVYAGLALAVGLAGYALGQRLTGAAPTIASLDPLASAGGPFTLTDGDGHRVSDRDFRGRWLLVYFGYTFCPDACPLALTDIADALAALGPAADKVQPVFISVDPQRDTPAVLAGYVKNFDPRIVGLTGSASEIAAVAKEYRVFYQVNQPAGGGRDYLVDHSSLLYVVDPQGKLATIMAGDTAPEQIARQLQQLFAKRG